MPTVIVTFVQSTFVLVQKMFDPKTCIRACACVRVCVCVCVCLCVCVQNSFVRTDQSDEWDINGVKSCVSPSVSRPRLLSSVHWRKSRGPVCLVLSPPESPDTPAHQTLLHILSTLGDPPACQMRILKTVNEHGLSVSS